jgi:hypothetical protein
VRERFKKHLPLRDPRRDHLSFCRIPAASSDPLRLALYVYVAHSWQGVPRLRRSLRFQASMIRKVIAVPDNLGYATPVLGQEHAAVLGGRNRIGTLALRDPHHAPTRGRHSCTGKQLTLVFRTGYSRLGEVALVRCAVHSSDGLNLHGVADNEGSLS